MFCRQNLANVLVRCSCDTIFSLSLHEWNVKLKCDLFMNKCIEIRYTYIISQEPMGLWPMTVRPFCFWVSTGIEEAMWILQIQNEGFWREKQIRDTLSARTLRAQGGQIQSHDWQKSVKTFNTPCDKYFNKKTNRLRFYLELMTYFMVYDAHLNRITWSLNHWNIRKTNCIINVHHLHPTPIATKKTKEK